MYIYIYTCSAFPSSKNAYVHAYSMFCICVRLYINIYTYNIYDIIYI